MKADRSTKSGRIAELAEVPARWLLGLVFIWMGLSKALQPVEFLKLVRQYDVVHGTLLLNSIAAALPWFEIICGGLMVAGIAVRGSALVLAGLLVPFTWMVLHRALALHSNVPFCAIRFDCGCGSGEVFVCRKLLENAILILVSIGLVCGRGRKCCVRYELV